ncbi:MAG: hypothetical protein Kow0010_13020 [Dehalococcoidia bacterium]
MWRPAPYLQLVNTGDLREAVGSPRPLARDSYEGPPRITSISERLAAGILDEDALLDRLDLIGSLAPHAPLSFLAVEVDGADRTTSDGQELLNLLAYHACSSVRATDVVGRLGDTGFGVILQGTSDRRAAAIAARLQHILGRLAIPYPGVSIVVSAASGLGVNAPVLPEAAVASLPASS